MYGWKEGLGDGGLMDGKVETWMNQWMDDRMDEWLNRWKKFPYFLVEVT